MIPFVWVGLEYFRSELYYLRFSWLSPGFVFGGSPASVPLSQLGTYGVGFVLATIAAVAAWQWSRSRLASLGFLTGGMVALFLWGRAGRVTEPPPVLASVHIAGVQLEFPTEQDVLTRLDELVRKHPETELVVLSEYTFADPPPDRVKDWCREHRCYLIVGGKEPAPKDNYYNTAFVISPAGEIVFRQAKSVPIQFFKDGLPAPEQKIWDSPWGKLGICVCYDLSYSRVTDRLVNLGAEALIVPTMDVADWGERQHLLHAFVAPLRAAEYRLPIFRVASSGISQWVDRAGQVRAATPCFRDGSLLLGTLELRGVGSLPLDRWLAPTATGGTAVLILYLVLKRKRHTLQSGKTTGEAR
jgi:apolipoprotein N-acyltransferase